MKKQSGRSMVEMLGTLAIIGVLSVTALTGYKIAMTKNRTNNILYDVNLAMNEIATREYLSLPEITQHVRDLGVRTELDIVYARNGGTESSGFFIQVNGVSEEVCESLRSNQTAFMTKIQPYDNTEQADDCADDIDVRAEFPYPPIEGGEVVEPAPCGSNKYFNKFGLCKNCPSGATCDGTANVICSDTSNYFSASLGSCRSCPSDATCDGTANVICSDTSKYFNVFYCRSCPSGATCDGTANVICSDTSSYFYAQWDRCFTCPADATCDGTANVICSDTSKYFHVSWNSCESCPADATCDGTANVICSDTSKYFYAPWGVCESCPAECRACPAGATCDGTTNVICGEGTWDISLECCVNDDWNCIY